MASVSGGANSLWLAEWLTDALVLRPGMRVLDLGCGRGASSIILRREFDVDGGAVPEHLRAWWTQDQGWCLHSATWWRRHWEKSGVVDIEVADMMPDGWQRWLDWHRAIAPDNHDEIQALQTDRGSYLGYVRLVGRRRADARLREPVVSVPVEYKKTPLLNRPT